MKTNLLITGEPGSGKTTLLKRAIEPYLSIAGGFVTTEMLEGDKRVGFRLEVLGGSSSTLAHERMYMFPKKVGRFFVGPMVIVIEAMGELTRAVEDCGLVVVDEIARMQLIADGFDAAVLKALDSSKLVIATVHARAHPFTDQIKLREDVELIVVTLETREECYEQIVACLERMLLD